MHSNATVFNKFKSEFRQKLNEDFADYLHKNWLSREEILKHYESGITPQQLTKLFLFERGEEELRVWGESSFEFIGSNGKKQSKPIFGKNQYSPQKFLMRGIIQAVPYQSEHLKKHLSLSQLERMKFDYLHLNDEEIKEIHDEALQKSAKIAHEKRRNNKHYSPCFTIDYWIEKKGANNEAEAKEMLENFKRQNSPFCIDFWLKRGWDYESAIQNISERAKRGAHATCNSFYGKCKSKLETRIFNDLIPEFNSLKSQHKVGNHYFDIFLPENKIIEVNGTFWHADPRIYSDPKQIFAGITVEQIWQKDKIKAEILKNHGYQLHVIWEMDYVSNPSNEIKKAKEFLYG